jgi:hypothetical protein
MPLHFEDFIKCFRKQFIFQQGHGGRRISKYHTAKNPEQGLKNDQWAIITFIYTGNKYGFTDAQLLEELNITPSLYYTLKEETPNILLPSYPDKLLHKKIVCKIGLIYNCILFAYKVGKPK